jgi:hypothetical protein
MEAQERRRFQDNGGLAERTSRLGRMSSVHTPAMRRSASRRFGERFRERLSISSCCLTKTDSATTARAPPVGEPRDGSQQIEKQDGQVANDPFVTSWRDPEKAEEIAIRHAQVRQLLDSCSGTSPVVVTSCVPVSQWFTWWILLKVPHGAPDIFKKQPGQITAHPESSYHSLDHEIVPICGHRVGRNLPPSNTQPIGKVI